MKKNKVSIVFRELVNKLDTDTYLAHIKLHFIKMTSLSDPLHMVEHKTSETHLKSTSKCSIHAEPVYRNLFMGMYSYMVLLAT